MKLYDITIEPLSDFGSPLKGDTLFGHFCWQAAYDPTLLEGGLERHIAAYAEKPFAVFSSAYPKIDAEGNVYGLKRPDLPFHMFFQVGGARKERLRRQKRLKAKKWMLVDRSLTPDLKAVRFLSDGELGRAVAKELVLIAGNRHETSRKTCFSVRYSRSHSTINRMTQTTGTGTFTPFSVESVSYVPGARLSVFVMICEAATDIERVCRALRDIGTFGFGRDASTGMGRYRVVDASPLPLPRHPTANACYTLAPSVPASGEYNRMYFSTFVRFGRHGDCLARSRNAFKNPVVMADEGAVLLPKDEKVFEKPYLGKAVTGVSKVKPETVVQGYAPYLPVRLEH